MPVRERKEVQEVLRSWGMNTFFLPIPEERCCIFYYSHYPFEIMNKIKLNGLTDKNIRADWYDNRCKILIKPEDKDTTGSIRFVFKLY